MKTQYLNPKNNQQGLSLVELMISMVVGLFLLAGVVTNFISTQGSDRMREAVSEMDLNASFAMKALRQTITHTGYGSTNALDIDKPFLTESDPSVEVSSCATSGRLNQINKRRTKDATIKDFITVVYIADNPCINGAANCKADDSPNINENALVYSDCVGGGAVRNSRDVSCSSDPTVGDPTLAKIYNTFRVTDAGELRCHGSRGGGQPIVDNVYAIQYLYGVRDEGTNSTAYRTADQVENDNRWGQVKSVQVGILMQSSELNLLKEESKEYTFQVLDEEVVIPEADRRRLFRQYTSTINLENLNKEPL